jgi:hypothetical protein
MTAKTHYCLLPLLILTACTGTSDDTSSETDTSEDSGTDSYTDTGDALVCGELEEATSSMAQAGTIDTDAASYLVCADKDDDDETCPDYVDLPGSFIEDTIGNPWGDPYCWYSVLAACGPETSIPDQCCYEFIFEAIACA